MDFQKAGSVPSVEQRTSGKVTNDWLSVPLGDLSSKKPHKKNHQHINH